MPSVSPCQPARRIPHQQVQLVTLALVHALLRQQDSPAAARKLLEDSDVKRAMEEGAAKLPPSLPPRASPGSCWLCGYDLEFMPTWWAGCTRRSSGFSHTHTSPLPPSPTHSCLPCC